MSFLKVITFAPYIKSIAKSVALFCEQGKPGSTRLSIYGQKEESTGGVIH
jgi:hypothetical protein